MYKALSDNQIKEINYNKVNSPERSELEDQQHILKMPTPKTTPKFFAPTSKTNQEKQLQQEYLQ